MGLSVYKFYAADREVEHVRKVSTLARISKQDYTILVCFSKTDNIMSMCQIAFAVAKKHQAQLVFLHVIELGENKKLQLEQPETAWAKQMLQEAQLLADEASIPARSIVKISHRISEGIVDTSMEENCNFIMTGRNKVGDFASRFFSSAIDNVLQKTTNEVAILHGDVKPEKVKRILIPYSGDIHTRLAIEISPALSDYFNAAVTIGVVVSPETPVADRQLLVEGIKNNLAELEYSAEVETIVDSDILHGILRLSKKSDLLVMGGKSGDFIELLFAKSLTREITEQAPCPVLWLKEFEERESFLSSMFKSKK
jgi:nucleotide-binding universal stress UspA family protein